MNKALIFANLLMLFVFILRFNTLPPEIPLFYSSLSEWQITDTWMIFLLPFLLNFLVIINQYFYKKYFSNYDISQKVFQYLNNFLIIGFTLIFIKIIFLIS